MLEERRAQSSISPFLGNFIAALMVIFTVLGGVWALMSGIQGSIIHLTDTIAEHTTRLDKIETKVDDTNSKVIELRLQVALKSGIGPAEPPPAEKHKP